MAVFTNNYPKGSLKSLRLIGIGKSVGEIVKVLNLAVTTISTYRIRILEKLKLKNNAEIIHYYTIEHLLTY